MAVLCGSNIALVTHFVNILCYFLPLVFGITKIVHNEFVPNGYTMNQAYYVEVLKRQCEKVKMKMTKRFAINLWILNHDSAFFIQNPLRGSFWLKQNQSLNTLNGSLYLV